MSKVNTVLGPIDSSALGYTRIHEHLLWMWPGIESDPLVEFDEESTARAVTDILLAMKNRGVSTVVDELQSICPAVPISWRGWPNPRE